MASNEVKNMYCPNCSNLCGDEDRFCFRCGTPLTEEIPLPPARPKKGSHWVPILVMVVLSVIGLIVYFATAPSDQPKVHMDSETPWFTIHEGYLFFDESQYTGGSELTVPDQVNGQIVYGLGEGCFENCTELTTVILPDTLNSVGSYAFAGCSSLRGIYLPESVTVLGQSVFSGCTDLEAICIPGSVTWIGPNSFDDCDSLFYILYSGTYKGWTELYDEFINIYTGVYCEDGSFYHRGNP